MRRQAIIHREIENTRSRTGPIIPALGTREHESDTSCGQRVRVSLVTRHEQVITCGACLNPSLSGAQEATDGR